MFGIFGSTNVKRNILIHNILKSTIQGFGIVVFEIETHLPIDTLLVDGPNFDMFLGSDGIYVPHVCLNDGDNQYLPI